MVKIVEGTAPMTPAGRIDVQVKGDGTTGPVVAAVWHVMPGDDGLGHRSIVAVALEMDAGEAFRRAVRYASDKGLPAVGVVDPSRMFPPDQRPDIGDLT